MYAIASIAMFVSDNTAITKPSDTIVKMLADNPGDPTATNPPTRP